MGLTKIRLGDYIERSTANNKNLVYGTDLIVGVTNEGIFTAPKGNPIGVDLRPYKIVNHGAFVYNPTRLDLGSIAYREDGLCIVSHLYIVFYLNEAGKKIIDPQYLFIYFRRKEFCREVTFRNFGSQRPEFSFSDMCDIVVQLPPYDIQQKYVAIYNAMLANQKSYERGLEDLKLVCDAYIEKVRENAPLQKLGNYITLCENVNFDLTYGISDVRGVNNQKELMPTKTSLTGRDLSKFQIVFPGDFVFNHRTSRNGSKFSIAYNDGENPVICTEDYVVFRIKPEYSHKLLARWLYMHFNRPEFDRYVITNSWGSSTEFFNLEDVNDVKIPVPDVAIQQDIVDIFNAYNTRKGIAETLKNQIRNICPILIKGSIEEAQKTDEA